MRRMRFVGSSVAVLALVGGLVWPASEPARPLLLAAFHSRATRPIGILWQQAGARVTAIDETKLRSIQPRTAPVGYVDAWAFSPDRAQLVLAAHRSPNMPEPDSIRFVQVGTVKLVQKTIRLDGTVRALLWNRPQRIVALVGD